MKEYFEDDRIIIPDYIKKMSREELKEEIEKLEEEEKERKLKKNNSVITA